MAKRASDQGLQAIGLAIVTAISNLELGGSPDGDVALDTATLAALETVQVGNFPAVQPVSGTVTVANPTTTVTVANPTTTVSVSNLPSTQPVSGTVTVANPTTNPETGLAKEATLGSILTELGQKYEGGAIALDVATLAALETISVANFPATQPVSGTVTANVGTGTQPVSGTFWQATQPVSFAAQNAWTWASVHSTNGHG